MNNWIKTSTLLIAATIVGSASFAQDAKDNSTKKEKEQEIIIRKKGDKQGKTTIVLEGDNVTINGKPVDNYKSDDITVLRRDRTMQLERPRIRAIAPNGGAQMFENFRVPGANRALLGVVTEKAEGGVKITEVNKESAAEKAGLKTDDVITQVGDTKIEDPNDLVEAIGKFKPNDKVDISYKRSKKESKTSVTLGENKMRSYSFNFDNKDFNFEFPTLPNAPNGTFLYNRRPKIGMQIQDVEEGKGVKVQDVDEDSPASKAGFKEGDVITEVNGKEIAGVDELRNEIKDLKEGDSVKMKYKRGGSAQTVEIKLPKRLKTADL